MLKRYVVGTFNKEKAQIGAFSVIVKTSRTIVSSSAPRCVVCAGAGLHGAAAGVSTLATPSAGRGRRRLSRAVATARVTLPRSHGHVTAVLRRAWHWNVMGDEPS